MLRFALAALFAFAAVARAELKFDSPVQEFRRSPSDRYVEARFSFKNVGETPVTIRRVRTSCGCTTARPDRDTFAPGETGEIAAKFSFGSRRGPQRKIITVTTADKTQTMLDLRVWIQEPVTLTPALVLWGVGEPAEAKRVDLAIDVPQKVRVTGVTSSNPRVTATLEPVKLGESYRLKVQPTDTAQKESAEIVVQTDPPAAAGKKYVVYARVK